MLDTFSFMHLIESLHTFYHALSNENMFGKSVNTNWIYYIILLLVLFVAPLNSSTDGEI